MIKRTNHFEQFQKLEGCFEKAGETYKLFNANPSVRGRKELEIDIKEFRLQLNNFMTSVRNL